MAGVANPLATGLVESLARPGGNLTGLSSLLTDFASKRVGLLHDIRPELRTVAFLGSPKGPSAATLVRETRTATEQMQGYLRAIPDLAGVGGSQSRRR
jgi:putative tryptophan/tyrosine transport system substrate-binding protein